MICSVSLFIEQFVCSLLKKVLFVLANILSTAKQFLCIHFMSWKLGKKFGKKVNIHTWKYLKRFNFIKIHYTLFSLRVTHVELKAGDCFCN